MSLRPCPVCLGRSRRDHYFCPECRGEGIVAAPEAGHPNNDERALVRALAHARGALLLDERALFDDYLKGLTASLQNAEEAIVALSRALDVTSEEAAATKKKLDAVGRLQDRGEARVKTLREIPRAGRQYLRRRLLDGRSFAENELRNLIPPNARRYAANLRARIAACDAVLAQLDEAEGKTRTTAAGDEQAPRQLSLFETLLREGRAKGAS